MYIELKGSYIEPLQKLKGETDSFYSILERAAVYAGRKDSFNMPIVDMSRAALDSCYDLAKEMNDRSVMMQLSSYLNLVKSKSATVSNIRTFGAALRTYFDEGAINHWVFVKHRSGYVLPYFIKDIVFKEARDKDSPAQVEMYLFATGTDFTNGMTKVFISEEIRGKTIEAILYSEGLIKETQELIDEYMQSQEKFQLYRKLQFAQFWANGSLYEKHSYCDDFETTGSRVINDNARLEKKYVFEVMSGFWGTAENPVRCPVPVHPFLYVYSLDHYQFVYAHVDSLTPYVYDDSLKDKLVLPKTHRTLLDILTSKMDILKGDIITGKSAGTTILCKGAPGTGKTLTAEAYSEITHKPLFKINSGQLGTSPDDIEKKLEHYLKLSARFGAVMLIDEADTFIRVRGNDMQHNAVVAAFLRTLEYFNGLLFLTTNRCDDIDEAIESRCIATITYQIPEDAERRKIWEILSKEFEIREVGQEKLSDVLIDKLLETFPKVSGRDIKELLKLTSRYAIGIGKSGVTLDDFITCAQFRGVEIKLEG